MTTTINASPTNGLVQTADGSGVLKVQSNGVTTNALAWVQFAGASGTRNSSYNVSSVTRSNTGRYVVNFTTAQTDANYSVVLAQNLTSGTDNVGILGYWNPTTTTLNVVTTTASGSAYSDSFSISVAVFGN